MSVDTDSLLRVAKMSGALVLAADALTRAESVEQAIKERVAHIGSLDGEISKRMDSLTLLTEKTKSLQESINTGEVSIQAAHEARMADIDRSVDYYRTTTLNVLKDEEDALRATLSSLSSSKSSLDADVLALTNQRDLLLAEIDAAKQRVANL